jgi:EAL domain-containing protein (putative c-di-GMP-specific phosphodiesterase class I)/FixJ family two-component response regulator
VKILIVDDDPFLLKILNLQLRNFGLRNQGFDEVVAFERGQQAIELLQAGDGTIGLVVCDLHMPEMDGLEFIRHLGRVGYRGGLVLVSGKGERILESAEQLARAHGLKLLGTIDKPVTPERLREILSALVGQQGSEVDTDARLSDDSLRRALRSGELVNFYQPVVSMKTGEIERFETLLRWRHPEQGLLLPGLILDAVNDRELRWQVTDHVIGEAIRQACRWGAAGHPTRVSANIALGADDLDLEFPERLAATARDAGLQENAIALELTFTGSIKHLSTPLEVLARLRLKHFRLCLDRFGTSGSTMELLRDIPVDEIKVDSGFVHGARHKRTLAAVLTSCVGLAHQLDLDAAAIGIEDNDDWDFVHGLDFDLGQGYFIGAPMIAADVPAWREQWQERRTVLVD